MTYIEKNRENEESKQHLYKRRHAMVEHLFGTIKRQWGFDYISTKEGIERASADVGFMFLAYNLRRLINILGITQLTKYLRALILCFLQNFAHIIQKISCFKQFKEPETYVRINFAAFRKPPYLA